jgi:hyperosmotically inducible protein
MRERRFFLAGVIALSVAALVAVSCAQTDAGITAKVKAKMTLDPAVKASEITVETKDKVVTLTGNVDSQIVKDKALELARNTTGVVNVVDMVAVKTTEGTGDAPEPSRSLGERIDDAGITMSVKAKLLEDPQVKGMKIDVDTRDGVVYLTGKVRSQAEKDKAIELARQAKGVRDVEANLTIESRS